MRFEPGFLVADGLELIAPLGAGAMGSVWSALDRRLDRKVAVKLIHAQLSLDDTAQARFQREASLAAKIASPHVVQIFSHGVTDSSVPYIVMELLEGQTLLERIIERGPMPASTVLEVIDQLTKALAAAHALGVVHRDIKPANIFLVDVPGYDLFVKVVDFGVAKHVHATDAVELTKSGLVVGTPAYMSPEQLWSNAEVDARTDLWATACVAYELLLGKRPFEGNSVGAIAVAMDRGVFQAPSEVVPSFGAELDAFFLRALANSPARRFEDARSLFEALRGALAGVSHGARAPVVTGPSFELAGTIANAPLAMPSSPPPTTTAEGASIRERRARRLWLAAAAVGVSLVAIALGFALRPRSPALLAASPLRVSAGPSVTTLSANSPPETPSISSANPGHGRLPPDLIQSTVHRNFEAFGRCFADDDLSVMRSMYFVIGVDGHTHDVAIFESDNSTPKLDACLVERFSLLTFPRPSGGEIAVVYPLMFTPDDRQIDSSACGLSHGCAFYGRCSAVEGECRVATDGDCTLSAGCVQSGRCTAAGGVCRASYTSCGPDSEACKSFGLCELVEGRCRAAKDGDCAQSAACTQFGLCKVEDGECVAGAAADCQGSRACRDRGRCTLGASSCEARTRADCAASFFCKDRGQCTPRAGSCAVTRDEDCASSTVCKVDGQCTAGPYLRCVASREADCKRSENCGKFSRCTLKRGECVAEAER
ncbi:MAG: protein kinase [Polyangiaceae bacterium]